MRITGLQVQRQRISMYCEENHHVRTLYANGQRGQTAFVEMQAVREIRRGGAI